jgi:hypothetical protein
VTYQKVNVLADLKRMAKGQKPNAEPWVVAMLAVPWVEAGLETNENNQLERLFRLDDPRKPESRQQ